MNVLAIEDLDSDNVILDDTEESQDDDDASQQRRGANNGIEVNKFWYCHQCVQKGTRWEARTNTHGHTHALAHKHQTETQAPVCDLLQACAALNEFDPETNDERRPKGDQFNHHANIHQPDVHQAEVHQAEVHQPDVHQAEVHQAEVHQPEVHQPEVHQPEVHQPEVHQADVHQAEVDHPEVHPPEVQMQDAGDNDSLAARGEDEPRAVRPRLQLHMPDIRRNRRKEQNDDVEQLVANASQMARSEAGGDGLVNEDEENQPGAQYQGTPGVRWMGVRPDDKNEDDQMSASGSSEAETEL